MKRISCTLRWTTAALTVVLSGCGTEQLDPPIRPGEESSSESSAGASPSNATSPSPTPSLPAPAPTPTPTAFTDGLSAGKALAAAEAGLRLPGATSTQLAGFGRTQQIALRALVANPEWRAEALAQLPQDIVPFAQANINAGAELRSLTKPGEKLPPWRIVQPPPAEELLSYYKQAEAEFGVPWQYLASIHLVETRMGRIRGTSTAGAQGPMQFIPSTWAAYGEGDINDPRDSILGAARYLKASGAPGNMPKALFAYNHSTRYVNAITIYAQQMMKDERTYPGYYNWQVFYRLPAGDVELAVGYPD